MPRPKKEKKETETQKQTQKQNVVIKISPETIKSTKKRKPRKKKTQSRPDMKIYDERFYKQLPPPSYFFSVNAPSVPIPLISPSLPPSAPSAPSFPKSSMIPPLSSLYPQFEDIGAIGTEGFGDILDLPSKRETLESLITPVRLTEDNDASIINTISSTDSFSIPVFSKSVQRAYLENPEEEMSLYKPLFKPKNLFDTPSMASPISLPPSTIQDDDNISLMTDPSFFENEMTKSQISLLDELSLKSPEEEISLYKPLYKPKNLFDTDLSIQSALELPQEIKPEKNIRTKKEMMETKFMSKEDIESINLGLSKFNFKKPTLPIPIQERTPKQVEEAVSMGKEDIMSVPLAYSWFDYVKPEKPTMKKQKGKKDIFSETPEKQVMKEEFIKKYGKALLKKQKGKKELVSLLDRPILEDISLLGKEPEKRVSKPVERFIFA